MPMKNLVQPFLDTQGITPYRFWHDTGISRVTAYKLYNDATYIPGADVLVKICDRYKIQPGVILVWTPDSKGGNQNDLNKQEVFNEEEEDVPQKQIGETVDNNPSFKCQGTRSFFAVVPDVPKSA